mgnify:CR=1 FL=1
MGSWPNVRECHMLAGEADFLVKIVAEDWDHYQKFLTTQLTSAPNVSHVKSLMVFRTAKYEPCVPIVAMLAAIKAFGRRNLAYLVFTGLLVLFVIWLESTSTAQGPDRGAGAMGGMAIWALVSGASIIANAILLIIGLVNKRPVMKEAIAVSLPFLVAVLGFGPLFV